MLYIFYPLIRHLDLRSFWRKHVISVFVYIRCLLDLLSATFFSNPLADFLVISPAHAIKKHDFMTPSGPCLIRRPIRSQSVSGLRRTAIWLVAWFDKWEGKVREGASRATSNQSRFLGKTKRSLSYTFPNRAAYLRLQYLIYFQRMQILLKEVQDLIYRKRKKRFELNLSS